MLIPEPSQELVNLAQGAKLWEKSADGFKVHLFNNQTKTFSFEELSKLDPRLPSYLLRNSGHQHMYNTLGVLGFSFMPTVWHWSGGYPIISTVDNVEVAVIDLHEVIMDNDSAIMHGSFETILKYVDDDTGLTVEYFPINECLKEIQVSIRWMDENYPSWSNLWNIAENLEIPKYLRRDYILKQAGLSTGASAELPNDLQP